MRTFTSISEKIRENKIYKPTSARNGTRKIDMGHVFS